MLVLFISFLKLLGIYSFKLNVAYCIQGSDYSYYKLSLTLLRLRGNVIITIEYIVTVHTSYRCYTCIVGDIGTVELKVGTLLVQLPVVASYAMDSIQFVTARCTVSTFHTCFGCITFVPA